MSNSLVPGTSPNMSKSWWRHHLMWLVVGGPVVVVVASFVTLYLAVHTPDPVYNDPNAADLRSDAQAPPSALMPALQARNHAATGGVPQQKGQSASNAGREKTP